MHADDPLVEPENISDRGLYRDMAKSSSWSIFSSAGANSLPHTDTAGAFTTVTIPHGGKLWAGRCAQRSSTHHDIRHLGFARDFDMFDADLESEDTPWFVTYLETGQAL